MAKTVVGLFENRNDAQAAQQELRSSGIGATNIGLIEGTASGLGGRLGGAGIPQQDAAIYEQGVQQGDTLLVVQSLGDAEAERAAAILDRYNIVDISGRSQGYQRMSRDRTTSAGIAARSSQGANTNLYAGSEKIVPIVEEELRVGKREVEGGGVRVNTRVEETPVNEQVTLHQEHVDVHRKPVDRPISDADAAAFQQGTFEVRERAEEAVVDKQARVVEEVHVKKTAEDRTETINDTVRRTDVDVQELGGATRRTTDGDMTGRDMTGTASHEGSIERGGSKIENAAERTTGADLNRDGDVGQRDPRNNI